MPGYRRFDGTKTSLVVAAILSFFAAFPEPASAESESFKLAKAHYMAGAAHYRQGHYKEALREFRESYKLSNKAALLFNMSQCYERLGDLKAAIDLRKQYLDAMPHAPNRREVEQQIQSLQTRLDATAVRLKGRIPKGAVIDLDGRRVTPGRHGRLRMPPGNHLITIQMQGREAFGAAVALAQGQQLEIPVQIRPPAEQSAGQPQGQRPSYLGIWLTLGAAGALLATATGLAVGALTNANEANDALDEGYLTSYKQIKSKAKHLALAADISFGLAGGLAATSLVLFLVQRHRAQKERPRAQVVPLLGPGQVGLSTSWSF